MNLPPMYKNRTDWEEQKRRGRNQRRSQRCSPEFPRSVAAPVRFLAMRAGGREKRNQEAVALPFPPLLFLLGGAGFNAARDRARRGSRGECWCGAAPGARAVGRPRDGDEAATGRLADPAAASTGATARQAGGRHWQCLHRVRVGAWAWAWWPLLLAYINVCFEAADAAHRAVSLATASRGRACPERGLTNVRSQSVDNKIRCQNCF